MQPDLTLAAYALSLKAIDGVGNQRVVKLLRNFPTIDSFAEADVSQLVTIMGSKIGQVVDQIRNELVDSWTRRSLENVEDLLEKNIFVVGLSDPLYPIKLAAINDPPSVLFARGNISELNTKQSVAIVGTRNPTENGYKQAEELSEVISRRSVLVVSGLAKGIDTAAHRGSVTAQAPGIAVFGTDLLTVYPKENEKLAQSLLECDGVLVSEITPGEPTNRGAFVRRDRIQAGLSDAVVPIQSGIGGGTMHTVKFAQDYGRPVLVPSPSLDDMKSDQVKGTQSLIDESVAQNFDIDDVDVFLRLAFEPTQKNVRDIQPLQEQLTLEL